MPGVNDYVNYGTEGVCKIEAVRSMKFGRDAALKNYYVLRPVHQQHEQIFVPVDNPELVRRMRPVLSKEEVDQTILSVKDEKMPWISDRKERGERFQEILSRRDERELLLLASCLYVRAHESASGLSNTDAQILKKAERIIDQEFSFSLQLCSGSISQYICDKLQGEQRPAV